MALSKTEVESHIVYSTKTATLSQNTQAIVNERRSYSWMKRAFDFTASLIGLIVLTPVFLIISLLIKLDDPHGRVFFKQIRVGERGKPFYIYKFRSMVSNAEQLLDKIIDKNETTGAMFKMKDDPRVTRIGHVLRKTSLDELPQLINVLKGDMSLVGPRPPLPREVEKYTSHDMQRLLVRPGCTGLWQVSGRSNLGFHEMVELDLKYIQERNMILDLKLIIRTVFLLFGSKNAF
ncbi:sugar transferase [Sporolactobacillus shoreicorticis]|uniref:Sugar transferase n=1 Tax=Sporolactobacillus shoreicorticis TaxID=1923877 RepID=A0ABW5S4G0_9BACL|nr:sugar transferase [Sporolactobacillus shoreicorticis]MCO7124203.1 sugar transferase [Sporolactobacillus shoreicorticis]